MKFALMCLATVTLAGCSQASSEQLSTGPSPLPPAAATASLTSVWTMVVDTSGVCIEGATLLVVGGQRVGYSATQNTPCDAWAYGGGAEFRDLIPGMEMTIRASAPGYTAQERTIVPSSGSQQAVLFVPARTH
jgi:hypothetical protein